LGAAAVAIGLAGAPVAARAARCPAMAGADRKLADVDGRLRLTWIDARLGRVGRQARIWAWGWGLGVGASGLASLAAIPLVSPADRVDGYTGAVSAAAGVIPFVVSPLDVTRDARELHARIEAADADPKAQPAPGASEDDQVCPLLLDAEARLVHDAANQQRQRGWWVHAGNVVFNAGLTLFLGFGFHHWEAGVLNGVAGTLVGEVIILTQPRGTVDDLRAYRAGEVSWGYAGAF
jgi:hypothetical protein